MTNNRQVKATQKEEREKLAKVVFRKKGNKAEMVKVVTGIADDTFIEIKSGIAQGDEVISGSYSAISQKTERRRQSHDRKGSDQVARDRSRAIRETSMTPADTIRPLGPVVIDIENITKQYVMFSMSMTTGPSGRSYQRASCLSAAIAPHDRALLGRFLSDRDFGAVFQFSAVDGTVTSRNHFVLGDVNFDFDERVIGNAGDHLRRLRLVSRNTTFASFSRSSLSGRLLPGGYWSLRHYCRPCPGPPFSVYASRFPPDSDHCRLSGWSRFASARRPRP